MEMSKKGWLYSRLSIIGILVTVSVGFMFLDLAPRGYSEKTNLVEDRVVTVTFVYFYEDYIKHPNWKTTINNALTDSNAFFQLTPDRPYSQYPEDVETWISRYTNLAWDWQFYSEIELSQINADNWYTSPEMFDGPFYMMYHWHKKNQQEAEQVWRSSDIVYGIVQDVSGGGAGANLGYLFLGSKTLWSPTRDEPFGSMPSTLAHELFHCFGASDHYSPRFVSWGREGTDPACLYGEESWWELDRDIVLCEYTLGEIDWEYLTKPSEFNVFYLGVTPDPDVLPDPDPLTVPPEPPSQPSPFRFPEIIGTVIRNVTRAKMALVSIMLLIVISASLIVLNRRK